MNAPEITLTSLLQGIAQMSAETVKQLMLSPALTKEWK